MKKKYCNFDVDENDIFWLGKNGFV